MKHFFLLFICLISLNSLATNVTFSVDVSNEDTADKNIYVTGGFAGWSLDNQMTDENTDGIYEITLDIAETTEFKFVIGNWEIQEDMSSKGCSPNSNRELKLNGESDVVLATETFNECSEQTYSLVTFSVDMNAETISGDGVFMTGLNDSWNHNDIQLTDEDNDGIYEVAIYLENGSSHSYNYINGNWEDARETCSEGKNRKLKVYNDNIDLPTAVFGVCDDNVQVVFSVDMSNETVGDDGVFMTGLNNSWNHNEIKLYDLNGDNIWETTVSLPKNSSHSYNYINGNWEDARETCPEGKNRAIDILEDHITQPTVDFGTCSQEIITVSTTFQVNMSGEELVDGKVFIIELNGKWEQADWVEMLDENNDGVFTATVDLVEGEQKYRFNNGSEWNDENLSGTSCGNEENNNRTITITSDGSDNPTQVLEIVAFNSCTAEIPTYEIKFSVNLEGITAATPGIVGDVVGEAEWGEQIALTQNAENENIWETVISLTRGQEYEYLFTNGDWEDARASCLEGKNRSITVNKAEELNVVDYGKCDVEPVLVDVTFQVNMNGEDLVDGKVFIVELNGKWEQADWVEMLDEDNDGIFTATVAILEGNQIFRYNNGSTWNDEDLTGKDCALEGNKNRSLTIVSDGSDSPTQLLDVVAFNACDNIVEDKIYKDVTFKVDATSFDDTSAGLYIASSWNNWTPESFSPMTDENNDGIWEATINLRAGKEYEFKYTLGNNWDDTEDMQNSGCEKPSTNNRYITLDNTSESLALDVVAFNSCSSDQQIWNSILFAVDISDVDTESAPQVIGNWSKDRTPIELLNVGNNVYSKLIYLRADRTYTYQFTIDDVVEDFEGDCLDESNLRTITVQEDKELPISVFNSCDESENKPSEETVMVTFKVNLSKERPSEEKVYLAGSWPSVDWNPELFEEMSDEDNDGIWEVTIGLLAGVSYEYQFTIGKNWEMTEDLSGSGCEVTGTKNRGITVGNEDVVLDVVCFNECSTCEINVISISVSGNNITEKGGTSLMTAIVVPLNASVKDIQWTVNNTDIASIDQNGLVTAKADGTVIVTATSLEEGSTIIGTKELTISGQVITAIVDNKSVLNTFPNPTSGNVTVSSEDKMLTILLFDINGKLHKELSIGGAFKTEIDLSNLNKGIYVIKVITSVGASTSRFILN